MRRVWIEMVLVAGILTLIASPSMRRVWIEILKASCNPFTLRSPSMRRVWIEINLECVKRKDHLVTLHAEGVD